MPGIDERRARSDEASLGDLLQSVLRFYRQFGRLLIPLAVLFGLLAGVAVALRPLYNVTALLDTPQMPLEQWRKLQPMLSDRRLVNDSLATADTLPAAQRDKLRRLFLQPRYWETRVTYRSTVEREDIRQQVNIDPKTVGALGLEISVNARDDAAVSQQLEAIALHIRQVMLWGSLRDYLDGVRQQTVERRQQLQISRIEQQFAIEQGVRQVAEMRELLEQYPQLRRAEINTVVSVGDGGGKYLSPLAQIVALQATMTETRANLRQAQRELEQLEWKQRFLGRADPQAQTLRSGRALADWLELQRRAVFALDASGTSAQRQVSREIELNLSQLRWRAQLVRYKAIPALSATPVPSRRPLLVAALTCIGALLAMSSVLALYVAIRRLNTDAPWSVHHDPAFAWLPIRLRNALLGPPAASCGQEPG